MNVWCMRIFIFKFYPYNILTPLLGRLQSSRSWNDFVFCATRARSIYFEWTVTVSILCVVGWRPIARILNLANSCMLTKTRDDNTTTTTGSNYVLFIFFSTIQNSRDEMETLRVSCVSWVLVLRPYSTLPLCKMSPVCQSSSQSHTTSIC